MQQAREMLDIMSIQLAKTNAALRTKEIERARKGGHIRRMENKLRLFTFDAVLYVVDNRDVFKSAEEQRMALRTMTEAAEWANKDCKQAYAQLEALRQEYRAVCNDISVLQDNIKTLERAITELKWCVKEDDDNTSQL